MSKKKIQLRNDIYEVLPNGVYDIKETAKYFDCSIKTIYRWLDKKIITGIKIGGTVKFKGQWILDVMSNKNLLIGKEIDEE
jgi:excisionase family DNA binding protein